MAASAARISRPVVGRSITRKEVAPASAPPDYGCGAQIDTTHIELMVRSVGGTGSPRVIIN